MNILYTLNDKFVPQVAAGICSVCENNQNMDEINFYLFSLQISDLNKNKLKDFVKRYGENRNIEIIELQDLESYFDFDFDTNGWNPIVLARLIIDKLLPENIHKLIYLDGDTIVRGSLKELWEDDLNGKVLGASIEPTVNKNQRDAINMEKFPYYNAGVLVVNLDIWKEKQVGKKILDYYKMKNGKLFANDQDAINGSLKGEIYTISPTYNFCNTFYFYPYRALVKMMAPVEFVSEEVFDDAKANPIIVHYLGEERPWRIANTHKYSDDYEKYLSMTPWKGQSFEDGWKLYFTCWKIFNICMKPFPMLRYKIITSLIPLFMKKRAQQLKKENK